MTDAPDLNLAVIGNCSYGALVDRRARVVWGCFPRFDGDPIFCHLLSGNDDADPKGIYEIDLLDYSHSTQRYIPNTAILVTTLHDHAGAGIEIVDFAPRFRQHQRYFHPPTLVRQIRCVAGTPRIRVRLRPRYGYGAHRPDVTRGSNHIRFVMPDLTLRLTTDAPVAFILEEVPFVLHDDVTLILGPDESLTESLTVTGRDFFERTLEYWTEFVRYLSIPFEWQEEVIRAAITLKLLSYDESGAIVAALTTSIPEAPGTLRTWDYRYCWLRDAYFVVHALNRLGATGTLERFLRYMTNIAAQSTDGYLQPVYGIALQANLDERVVESLAGYRGMGPVRVGNQAYQQTQNDGYGSVVLAATQAFFDRRLAHPGTFQLFELLEEIGEQAARRYDQPDAGLWEYRDRQAVHTSSSVMCWAACDRLSKIASTIERTERSSYWRAKADEIREVVLERTWRPEGEYFASTFDGDDIDASVLLFAELGFLAPDDPRFAATVRAVERTLRRDGRIHRYQSDEFGEPGTAFTICTFWYIDALTALGRRDEARALFDTMLQSRNHVGLLSEDLGADGELWGNFPQTYSLVGLINSAMRLSKSWEEAF